MEKDAKIFVAGHKGLVGSAICKRLQHKGYHNIIRKNREELDLLNPLSVAEFFQKERPEYVFMAAAKVGGIVANNTYRADFIYENLKIQDNIIHQSYLNNVRKLMFLGSTCIYPKNCPQPIKEEYLLTGPLEYTNEPYAIAKIAGIKMCESYNLQYGTNFLSAMPTNLYGPHDNYNLETSHVLPAILRKVYLGKCLEEDNWKGIREDLRKRPIQNVDDKSSKEEILKVLKKFGVSIVNENDRKYSQVEIWGSGKALREFLWSEDMADACIYIMEKTDFEDLKSGIDNGEIRNTHINIGTGKEVSIGDLARLIKKTIKFKGELFFNLQKPEGTPRKVTDPSKLLSMGWRPRVSLEEGIERMYTELTGNDLNINSGCMEVKSSA